MMNAVIRRANKLGDLAFNRMIKDTIDYGTSTIDYTLEYANRRTLGIKVYPDKTVQVIAPTDSAMPLIKEKILSKAAWIVKQQNFFLSFFPKTPPRKYVSGETHLYLGRQYRLKLHEAAKKNVKLYSGYIHVYTPSKTDKKQIKKQLQEWYAAKAEIHFKQLFEENIFRSKAFYSDTPTLQLRWLEKRWGSCTKKGQIILNIELIKAPKKCIEYVIVHELCHLAHFNHSQAFYQLLEKTYPDWKKTKDRLERLMV